MDDATQKLVDEARRAQAAVYLATDRAVADDLSRIIAGLADALEAAQRPTVSPEQREAVAAEVAFELAAAGVPPQYRWAFGYAAADAILARFSLPVLDPEAVAVALRATYGDSFSELNDFGADAAVFIRELTGGTRKEDR